MKRLQRMITIATKVNLFREGKPQWQEQKKEKLRPIVMNHEELILEHVHHIANLVVFPMSQEAWLEHQEEIISKREDDEVVA